MCVLPTSLRLPQAQEASLRAQLSQSEADLASLRSAAGAYTEKETAWQAERSTLATQIEQLQASLEKMASKQQEQFSRWGSRTHTHTHTHTDTRCQLRGQ